MSIKKYFENVSNIKALSGKTSHDLGGQVESAEYHEQDIINEERFIPDVDFTKPENFARYGSAEEYYSTAIRRIYETYPYDGSLKERLEWQNKSTYLDLYIYDDRYPRTNGYIIFSSASWGTQQSSTDGYGLSDTLEYISFDGGPNNNPNGLTPSSVEFTGSNYYEVAMNRKSNLQLDLASEGASVEFWMKKDAFDTTKTQKEVIFDLWNGKGYASPDYARLTVELTSSTGHAVAGADPFRLTIHSGALGFQTASVCSSNFTTASVTDGKWHHYAFTLKSASVGVQSRFYVDGALENEATIQTTGSGPTAIGTAGINDIDFYGMRATIGALATNPSASTAATGSGKLSASLDEFRYWKTQRTGEQIGRFWFTQVGGGVNTDPTPFITTKETVNTDLGVYYKFNEGITDQASTDSTVLDYSGRLSNGTWTGYTSGARNTGSAIVLSTAAIKEFKDPIIYPFHPRVHELLGAMRQSGSAYDVTNNASIYNSIPSWIIDDDVEGSGDVKKLTQILSSYFDTLHMQIDNLNKLKDISYVSGSNKPLPFSEKLLTSYGFIAPELFLDADILEKLANRSEDKVYEKSLEEVKNIIYQNIYNNLSYIYKSKGTEKGFRNLIRCFGIDDELIKINMYADGIEYNLDNDRRNITVSDRYINFNTDNNKFGSVFNYQDHTNSVGFITSSTSLSGGHSFTLETELLLPLKPLDSKATYIDTNVISSSLFGAHGVVSDAGLNQTGWPTGKMSDAVNFQVYAVRDEIESTNARFVLTGSTGGYVPSLKSSLYENIYDNTKWNISVRVRPENYPLANFVSASNNGNFVVELHGVQAEAGEILQEFTVSGTVTNPTGSFITGSKRVYVGAHRTDFTSSTLATSDVKVNACRYWLDYLDDETLKGHVLDTENHGNLLTNQYAYVFNPSASNGDITKFDTLVFNWEFLNNTGSNASGQFTVEDISSGSAALTRFGSLGNILNRQHTALGYDFATSSVSPIDKDFVVSSKLNLPENIQSADMIKVLSAQEQDIFTNDSRPVNYYFAFEKSMYQVVSEEIINYFANLKDFHNLIGDPVNLYRPEYKSLKFLRQKFFEKVANPRLDFDKFYEFYKWFDSSLSVMLGQLVPASADFSDGVRTIIEDHVLERSKNRRIFPFLERKGATDITASVEGGGDANASFAPESPPGSGFFTNTAFTKRQIGSSNTLQINPWKHVHAPLKYDDGGTPKSLLFDGDDEYIYGAGTAAAWEDLIGGTSGSAKAFSVSFWINPTSLTNLDYIFQVGGANGTNGRQIQASTSDTLLARIGPSTTWRKSTALSTATWQHVVYTFEGGSSAVGDFYINAAVANGTSNDGEPPGEIVGQPLSIGGYTGTAGFHGYMCDFAVWDKELSSAEITEIYGLGKRVYLNGVSCESNLLSWWRMGSDPRDTYNGLIYDQTGGRNGTTEDFDSAADIAEVSPPMTIPYRTDPAVRNDNIYWHRYREDRYGAGLATTSSVDSARQDLLRAIKQSYNRRVGSPAKFSVEGAVTFGGVARHQSNQPNYVFREVAPLPGASGSLTNILVTQKTDVEELISSSSDVYYPSTKQRLGFKMNPDINTDTPNDRTLDGNVYAPFSMYSSSVSGGYASRVSSSFMPGVEITNLHHDYVKSHDIPMQGPFTEKFVGGRFYRHTPLNRTGSNGTGRLLDSDFSRGEAFRIQLAGVASTAGGNFSNSLAVIPADSSGSATSRDFPTAVRFRDETAKRPVNIKNILMTTASLDVKMSGTIMHSNIGNYQKNYQVVQTSGRTTNDFYFRDQSITYSTASCIPFIRRKTTDPVDQLVGVRWPLSPIQDKVVTTTSLFSSASAQTTTYGGDSTRAISAVRVPYNIAFDTGGQEINDTKGLTFSCWYSSSAINAAHTSSGQTQGTERAFFTQGVGSFWSENVNGTSPIREFDWSNYQNKLRFKSLYTTNTGDGVTVTNCKIDHSHLQLMTGSHLEGWHHIAVTWEHSGSSGGGTTSFYIDGSKYAMAAGGAAGRPYPIASGSVMTTTTASYGKDLTIKAWFNAGTYHLYDTPSYRNGVCGYMDEVVWHNSVLSQSHIETLYNNGCPMNPVGATGEHEPLGWWGMGEGLTGSTSAQDTAAANGGIHIADRTGNGYSAFLTGSFSNDSTSLMYRSGSTRGLVPCPDSLPDTRYLDFLLPNRDGKTGRSTKTVFVNRFSAPGSYEASSRGYMTQPAEEFSPYNAAPYRNRTVISYGMSGSASVDPITAITISPRDQIDKPRGLNQLDSLHCGPFGSDAAYGSVPSTTYVTVPSWHKTNRNVKYRIVDSYGQGFVTSSNYDNHYVQHQIPQSVQQYSWVSASVPNNNQLYGLSAESCTSASVLQLVTSSDSVVGFPWGNIEVCDPANTCGSPSYDINSGYGVFTPFTDANLQGPVGVRPISIADHVLYRPQGTFNRRSIYMSGTNSVSVAKNSQIYIGTSTKWNALIGSDGSGAGLQPFTLACWVNLNEQPAHTSATIFDFGGAIKINCAPKGVGWIPQFTIDGATDGIIGGDNYLDYGKWYHIVATFGSETDPTAAQNPDGDVALNQQRFYINGEEQAVVQYVLDTPTPIGASCYIGNVFNFDTAGQSKNWCGNIDEVQIYTSSVDNDHVNILYNNTTPADPYILAKDNAEFQPICDSLIAWWRAGDGEQNVAGYYPHETGIHSGAVFKDYSGNGNSAMAGLGAAAVSAASSYFTLTSSVPANSAGFTFNTMMLHRNGPYGWPTWKQIRAGEHPIARRMRKQNLIGSVLAPPFIADAAGIGGATGKSSISFADFYESPISDASFPINFIFEDNTENASSENNMQVAVPYANELEYFSHNELNNLLNLKVDTTRRRAYNSVLDYAVQSNLSLVANYAQRVYPSEKNVYRDQIRRRQDYNISTIWFDSRLSRTSETLRSNASCSMGYRRVLSQSMWPLDGHNNFKTTSSLARPYHNDGAGELLPTYTVFTGSTDDPLRVSRSSSAEANAGISAFPNQYAGPTYAQRIYGGQTLVDDFPVLAGDAEWLVAEQAGKAPYQNYKTYEAHIREIGKDHSIIPEFRISEHMETYVDGEENNFLTEINGLFELTGAAYSSSAQEPFFRTYSNGDFLKYFKIIDDDLFGKRAAPLTIVRDKITLSCDGLIKFLPYKGFTPAERTLELARLFSASYAPRVHQPRTSPAVPAQSTGLDPNKRFRILMDPLFSPGILYNTVKSGIAMSNFIVCHTGTAAAPYPMASGSMYKQYGPGNASSPGQQFEEGYLYMSNVMNVGRAYYETVESNSPSFQPTFSSRGYNMQQVPFEAIYNPEAFFNASTLTNLAPGSGTIGPAQSVSVFKSGKSGGPFIYDREPLQTSGSSGSANRALGGVTSFLTSSIMKYGSPSTELPSYHYPQGNAYIKMNELKGSALYRMAIDNFLCESANIFSNGFANFESKREENYSSVISGSIYTMEVRLYRTSETGSQVNSYPLYDRNVYEPRRYAGIPDRKRFTMYSRESAFGPPAYTADILGASFAHCSPPYYNQVASALCVYSASAGGIPTLQDIYDNLSIHYNNPTSEFNYLGNANIIPWMGINSCVNLTERLLSVPAETQVQKSSWAIQSKYETPVLNFANASASAPPSASVHAGYDASRISTKGMWHQYGSIPSASDEGIFIEILNAPTQYNRSVPGYPEAIAESLASVVGFETGVPKRVGQVPDEHKFEEAIVAVPFKTADNQRQFFALNVITETSLTYQNLVAAMDKYVFPPKMDFTRHPEAVTPILMYVFEFGAKLTKKDLTDMWQNLMPSIASKFEQKKVVVEDKELVDILANNTEDVRWMVFKVKKRAQKNFERFRRSMLTSDLTGFESDPIGPYSYNWPYDYFSLVELASIEEGVQYKSADLINQIDTNEAGAGSGASGGGAPVSSGTPTGGGATGGAPAGGGSTNTGGSNSAEGAVSSKGTGAKNAAATAKREAAAKAAAEASAKMAADQAAKNDTAVVRRSYISSKSGGKK